MPLLIKPRRSKTNTLPSLYTAKIQPHARAKCTSDCRNQYALGQRFNTDPTCEEISQRVRSKHNIELRFGNFFVCLHVWKIAQNEARPENILWFPKIARSVWDAFRGIMRLTHYPRPNVTYHSSRNCANVKQIPYPRVRKQIQLCQLAKFASYYINQYALQERFNTDPTCEEISQQVRTK